MISCTSPPEQKFPPAPVSTMQRPDAGRRIGFPERPEQVAQLRVGLEGERVLPLGAIQRDDAHAPFLAPQKVFGVAVRTRS